MIKELNPFNFTNRSKKGFRRDKIGNIHYFDYNLPAYDGYSDELLLKQISDTLSSMPHITNLEISLTMSKSNKGHLTFNFTAPSEYSAEEDYFEINDIDVENDDIAEIRKEAYRLKRIIQLKFPVLTVSTDIRKAYLNCRIYS